MRACSCIVVGTGCGPWSLQGEGAVFLGKVTAKVAQARPDTGGAVDLPVGYAVHFSVGESFYGVSDPGAEAVVYTGSGAGDCGYPFVVGTSYLVYAGSGGDGRLSTGTCSGTKPEIISGGILRQLRAIRDRGHGFELFGTVFVLPKGAGSGDQLESQPLDRVPVRAVGSHGSLFSTVTDQNGVYSFAWLPPDTYHLEEALPAGFTLAQGAAPQPFVITAADKQVPGFGCSRSEGSGCSAPTWRASRRRYGRRQVFASAAPSWALQTRFQSQDRWPREPPAEVLLAARQCSELRRNRNRPRSARGQRPL